MNESGLSITLSEWETLSPANCDQLVGRYLDNSSSNQRIAEALKSKGMLSLMELRQGLQISSFSFVGRIRIGALNITIQPKLRVASLLRLLRYAYGFRRLELIGPAAQMVDRCGLEDLLICQLNIEAEELMSRGLQRCYVQQDENLASPRGRINIDRLALGVGLATPTLPCRHFLRIEDTLLNRVLLAGLRLAGSLASLLELRRESRRLAARMEGHVTGINLDSAVLDQAAGMGTRLSTSYAPALSIIRLLIESQGIVLEDRTLTTRSPGFLFDMNRFFQALLSRFLKENLVDCSVREEHNLKGMMGYNPQFNPKLRQSPTPRPDYVVMQQGQLVSILDAKYRDLWEKPLPREMLYQLVVYAVSHRQKLQSSILYPTADPLASEARIDVTDPVFGKHLGQVCLRPVFLNEMEELVSINTEAGRRKRELLAKRLAFGAEV